jgi:hypothetical protein
MRVGGKNERVSPSRPPANKQFPASRCLRGCSEYVTPPIRFKFPSGPVMAAVNILRRRRQFAIIFILLKRNRCERVGPELTTSPGLLVRGRSN